MENHLAEIMVSYSTQNVVKQKITSSQVAFQILLHSWNSNRLELQEECKVLLLNRGNNALGVYHLSKGGVSGTVVDVKLVFAVALKCNASGIILCHNHPSGNLCPSEADKFITSKIKKAGELLDIVLADHLIITTEGYYSFSENGLL